MNEIAYSLNEAETSKSDRLTIDLCEVAKEGFITRLLPDRPSRKPADWNRLTGSSADKEALSFLFKEESAYRRSGGETLPFDSLLLNRIRISPSRSEQAFQLLAGTQKLFYAEKQLVVDLFGGAELYYSGCVKNGTQLEITARLKWGQTDIALADCTTVVPGKPHRFLYGITLRAIRTDISRKALTEFKQGPLLLEGDRKRQFLEESDFDDPDAPKLMMQEGSSDPLPDPETTPYPLLKLADRRGAFANLWMVYGEHEPVPFFDTGTPMQESKRFPFKRGLKAETDWEKDLLETDFVKKIAESSRYYCPLDKVAKSLTFLLELGWKIEDYSGRRVLKQTEESLAFEDLPEAIVVKGTIRYETHEADVKDVIGAFNRRDGFIFLSEGFVGLLPADETTRSLQDLADEAEWIDGQMRVKKHRIGSLSPLFEKASLSASLEVLKQNLDSFSGIEEALPSEAFQGQLRPYQQAGVNWLSFLERNRFHGILADEMGLGKTVQILAFFSRLARSGPHLIVLPVSLIFNWRNEIERFLPDFKVTVHQGIKRTKNPEELKKADIVLTSYGTMRSDLPLFEQLDFYCLVLDEAQTIKNAETQTAQAACRLNARLRLSVTGTPVENRPEEIRSHFRFLIPGLFGSAESFQADLSAGQVDRRHLDRIKRKIAPFFLRRRKSEVAQDLPPRIDQVVWVEMEEEQRRFYENLLVRFKSGLLKKVSEEGIKTHRMEVLEAILRLRQACCHPALLAPLFEGKNIPGSAKFEALMEDLQTIAEEGQKVLVYSQFTSMLKLMTREADKRGLQYGYLDGGTSNREKEVTRFQQDPSQSIFFVSLKAGGVGLNLTAADYVYLYDPWWNDAVEEQAINRAHRIGRKESVVAKRFAVAESIEEKIMKLKTAKKALFEELFDSGDPTSSALTIEDLYFLLD